MRNTRYKIIYIMGYGRSGSTLIDILLSNAKGIATTGALSNFFEWVEKDLPCACKQKMSECHFWSNVNQNLAEKHKIKSYNPSRVQKQTESMLGYLLMVLRVMPSSWRVAYASLIEALFSAVSEVSGSRVIVDSSKSTRDCVGRPLAMSLIPCIDLKVIFLTRDGRGVAWSAMKSPGSYERSRFTENKLINFLRVSISWFMTNVCALLTIKKLGEANVLHVRYEDLCTDPTKEVRRISEYICEDLSELEDVIERDELLSSGHNLGGNRLRFKKHISIKHDRDWEQRMPKTYSLFFTCMAWPLLKKLGYNGRVDA